MEIQIEPGVSFVFTERACVCFNLLMDLSYVLLYRALKSEHLGTTFRAGDGGFSLLPSTAIFPLQVLLQVLE